MTQKWKNNDKSNTSKSDTSITKQRYYNNTTTTQQKFDNNKTRKQEQHKNKTMKPQQMHETNKTMSTKQKRHDNNKCWDHKEGRCILSFLYIRFVSCINVTKLKLARCTNIAWNWYARYATKTLYQHTNSTNTTMTWQQHNKDNYTT